MEVVRRFVAVLLVLGLGLGMPVLSAQAGEPSQAAVEMPADQEMPADCGACGEGDMAMSPSACFTACIALQTEAWPGDVALEVRRPARPFSEQRFSGWAMPPEPQPPRVHILA